ncbi:MAG TPA: fatty acid desaturase [Pyrinomonadaceae bacterium]|jgi:fatty acid desaturase
MAISPTGQYRERLKRLLPPAAFEPSPRKGAWLLLHVCVALACYAAIGRSERLWDIPLYALLAGNSVACVGVLLHEVGHYLIVRSRPLKVTVELLCWAMLFVPRGVWVVFHNAHHARTNTAGDPDRPFIVSERSRATSLYSGLFYPSRENVYFKPLIGTRYVLYLAQHLAAALLLGSGRKPSALTATVSFSRRRRLLLLAELAAVALVQCAVFLLAGASPYRFLWTTPASVCVASAIISSYHFTEHFLRPVGAVCDPLRHTTSVKVWRFFDVMYFNLSYHTEHHLFPGMNSDYYPSLSRILEEQYADSYERLDFREAWRRLWDGDAFKEDPPPAGGAARPLHTEARI